MKPFNPFRRPFPFFFAALIPLASTLSACQWDNDLYNKYVNDDGSIVHCSSLVYIEKNDPNNNDKTIRCALNCPDNSQDNCLTIEDPLCADEEDALTNGICPKNKSCLKTSDPNNYYCGLNTNECTANGDCKTKVDNEPGWASATCIRNKCVAEKCNDDYHLYQANEKDPTSSTCESDSIDHCGDHDTKCGEGAPNAEYTNYSCKEATCTIAGCKTGYHLNEAQTACEPDDLNHCGSHNNDCTQLTGWESGECKDGQCIIAECDKATSFKTTNDAGKIECILNSNEHCGSPDNKCSEDMACSEGVCSPSCKEEFKYCPERGCVNFNELSSCGSCKPCNIENADKYECTYAENPSCTEDDSCCKVVSCNSGYHVKDNKCEPDSVTECGDVNTKCPEAPDHATSICTEGKCSFKCNEGYGNCNNDITDGCEILFEDYGLSSCDKCDSSKCDSNNLGDDCYIPCGNHSVNGSIIIPLCLSQGNYYKNYEGEGGSFYPCSNDDFRYHKYYYNYSFYDETHTSVWNNSSCEDETPTNYVNYEYVDGTYDKVTNYRNDHYYKQMSKGWNDSIYKWSSPHCDLVCNNNANVSTDINAKHNILEDRDILAHKCKPKQQCHQHQSFELKTDVFYNNYYYFEYGCDTE